MLLLWLLDSNISQWIAGLVQEKCSQTIEKYGVGSCGPRGFYGTIDVHLDLEVSLLGASNDIVAMMERTASELLTFKPVKVAVLVSPTL
jgi:hypothetical protein